MFTIFVRYSNLLTNTTSFTSSTLIEFIKLNLVFFNLLNIIEIFKSNYTNYYNTKMEKDAPAKEYKLEQISQNLGDKVAQVSKIIEEVSKPLFEKPPKAPNAEEDDGEYEDDFDDEDDEVMSGIEQKMASDIKQRLDKEIGGNWAALVGNRFNSLINHLEKDRRGSFKYGNTFVDVFELNNF